MDPFEDENPPGLFSGVAGAFVLGLATAWALAVLLLPFALLAAILHYLTS